METPIVKTNCITFFDVIFIKKKNTIRSAIGWYSYIRFSEIAKYAMLEGFIICIIIRLAPLCY